MNYLFDSYPQKGFGFIYKYTSPSNKSYIGQTINSLNVRAKGGSQYKNCTFFYNAIKKYGFKNFTWEILGEFPIEELSEKEMYFIQKYNTFAPDGYNLRTEKQSLKYTEKSTGQKRAVKKYDLNGNYIQTFESLKDAAKDNNVTANSIGRCCRGESKRSGDYIYRYADDNSIVEPVSKLQSSACAVVQYDQNMNYIATYQSLHQAGRAMGKTKAENNIRLVCKGKRKKAYGYIWRFLSEVKKNESF